MVLALLAIRLRGVRTLLALQTGLSLALFGSVLAYYLWPGFAARLVFFDVAAIAINPGYRPDTGPDGISIDLALLRLSNPLPSSFEPVELPHDVPVELGRRLQIAGFGHTDEQEQGTPGILRTAVLAVSGPISPVLVRLIDPEGSGLGGCTGDSGAPLFTIGQPVLAAVAIKAKGTNGYSCGAATEAVLAEPQVPWISKVLNAWRATDNMTL